MRTKKAESEHPEAPKSIATSFYMDDYLGGPKSPEKAKELLQIIDKTLSSTDFSLRKYTSSDPLFFKSFSSAKAEKMLEVKYLFNT